LRPLVVIIVREFARFLAQKTRLLSALVRPLFWLLVFAAGFKSTLGIATQPPYATYVTYDLYVVPGLVAMMCLFNGMQSSLAMVYDRESGAMKVLMTAPISRARVLVFKLIAATLVSTVQAYLFIGIAMATGIDLPWIGLLTVLPALLISAFALALAGLLLASWFRGLENFAGVMNFVIFPAFFLSSALYPLWQLRESSELIYWISVCNPFTHLIEMIRFGLHGTAMTPESGANLVVLLILTPLAGYLFRPEAQ
jgi:ABC-2 type transport system permease protein